MSELFATTGTIAAIATAVVPQQGSVGIVRVSGSQAMAIAQSLFHTPGRQVWESHRILYGYIRATSLGKPPDSLRLHSSSPDAKIGG